MSESGTPKGLVGWFADNPVAANLLMFALLLGGVLGLIDIRQEITPDFTLEGVSVSMAYPGATPEEVEQGIILAIEKELTGMAGIDTITATAGEGSATVTAELREDADAGQVLQDVRNAVSRITSFPDDAEPARVELRQHGFYVISIGVAADLAQQDLYQLSERIRRQVLDMQGVSEVNTRGALEPQISFEVSQETLRAQGLTLAEVADILRNAARDVPAGRIETEEGEVLLRTLGRREYAEDFADIPIKTNPDGTRVLLRDIARIQDGFEDSTQIFEFNGRSGMRLDIYQAENQRPVELAQRVRELVSQLNRELPESIEISVQNDRSERYAERRDILLKNGALGLLLVIVVLGAFLNPRLAFWVAVSIPVVFIGTFSVLPYADVTLNMISMFAFILAVGIVVDDAIIVGENIHAKAQQGLPIGEAVQQGAREMVVPVIYAVGTNIVAFIPLLLVPGPTGQFMRALPIVACIVFTISLVEALLVLPSHLNHKASHLARLYRPFARVKRFHDAVADSLDKLRDGPFQRLLVKVLAERYLVVTLFGGLLALVIAWNEAGRIDLEWRPQIPGNRVDAELDMPVDASLGQTLAAVRKIEAAGLAAIEELGGRQYLESWFTRVGWRRPSYGDVNMFLVPDDQRPFTQEEFTREWRAQLGDLPEAKSLFFEYLVGPGGNKSLAINVSHADTRVLERGARALATAIGELQGVVDVSDGVGEGKRQLAFEITAEGRALGLSETSLGRQIRHAFYGAEVQRILRQGKEVKVMVRLPREQRLSLSELRRMILRAPDGTEIPLFRAARVSEGRAYSSISREDGRRILKVQASIDKQNANSRQIRDLIESQIMPEISARYPELQWKFAGGRRDRNETFRAIFKGLLWSALVIFALLAALFRSYSQGLIVMTTIPFALAGAIAGHVVMGYDLSSVSIYGMIALGGLVVNGALVLTVRLNELPQLPRQQAIIQATCSRFRPILLTALTTTVGLLPMLFETSTQALFLVPMAIALTFGTIAAFFVVLLFIPAMHAIAADVRAALSDGEEDFQNEPKSRESGKG